MCRVDLNVSSIQVIITGPIWMFKSLSKQQQQHTFMQNLEFHGVMRFCYEDHIERNTATKCLRVCSKSSTREIIGILSEKFRPDMKIPSAACSLYEVQAKKGEHAVISMAICH